MLQAHELNHVTGIVVDEAVRIHIDLGPGLMESVYEVVLSKKLLDRGLKVGRQRAVPITYQGHTFEEAFRLDLLVEDEVVVELKSVEGLAPVHFKQVLTYLRLLDLRVGLLINFGAPILKDGIHRIVNKF